MPFFLAKLQALSGWLGIGCEQPFSSPFTYSLSGLGFSHSRTFTLSSLNYFCVGFAVCFGSLSCWKTNLLPSCTSQPSLADWVRLSSRIVLYFTAFMLPSTLTSLPGSAAEKHPHSMMLPPSCFTAGMVRLWWCAVFIVCQTLSCLMAKKHHFGPLDHRVFHMPIGKSLHQVNNMSCFFYFNSGFLFATFP